MKTRRLTDFQKMLVGMAIIISGSLFLHVKVFSKSARAYRNLPTAYETPVVARTPGAALVPSKDSPLEGKVVVIGSERFYLDAGDGKRKAFLYGDAAHPQLGDKVKVSFSEGSPPTTLKLEPL